MTCTSGSLDVFIFNTGAGTGAGTSTTHYGGQILEPQLQKKGLKTLSDIRILARDGAYAQRTSQFVFLGH
jgi:hypothetical protein